jgi:hypothetical protein
VKLFGKRGFNLLYRKSHLALHRTTVERGNNHGESDLLATAMNYMLSKVPHPTTVELISYFS